MVSRSTTRTVRTVDTTRTDEESADDTENDVNGEGDGDGDWEDDKPSSQDNLDGDDGDDDDDNDKPLAADDSDEGSVFDGLSDIGSDDGDDNDDDFGSGLNDEDLLAIDVAPEAGPSVQQEESAPQILAPIERNGQAALEFLHKKLSNEEWRDKYANWLTPRAGRVLKAKYNVFDPASFKHIDVSAHVKTNNIDAHGSTSGVFESRMRHIWSAYKASAEDKIAGRPSLIDPSRVQSIKRVATESDIRSVLANMHPDTKRVLDEPRSSFGLQSLLRMAPVSKSDLSRWVVYIVIYELPNGQVWLYIGSSTSREGSFYRLYKTYETAVRYFNKGVFHSYLRLSGAVQRMPLAGKGTKMHVRVLCSWDIPEDPIEYARVKKIVLRTEAMFMDDFQAFPDAEPGEFIKMGQQKISKVDINTFSRSVAPPGEPHSCHGVNRMHPFAVSFQTSRSVRSRADRRNAALAKQDGMCRLDQRLLASQCNIFLNHLDHSVSEYDDTYVCQSCHDWDKDMDDGTRARVKACTTVEELIDIRHEKSRFVDIDAVYAHVKHCVICERPFKPRPASTKNRITNGKNTGSKPDPRWRTKIRPTARKSVYCLRKILVCCVEDSVRLESVLEMARRHNSSELKSDKCDMKMLRDKFAGSRARLGRHKARPTIQPGERCGLCRCTLRQLAATEKLTALQGSHDPHEQAGGLDIEPKVKAKIDCLANVTWHACVFCHKRTLKMTGKEDNKHGVVMWKRNITLAAIQKDIADAKRSWDSRKKRK
jgi:hypothetical protein